jgi:hypothetical protein
MYLKQSQEHCKTAASQNVDTPVLGSDCESVERTIFRNWCIQKTKPSRGYDLCMFDFNEMGEMSHGNIL